MPILQREDTALHFERMGVGPTLTICGGLGDSYRNWQLLIQKLSQEFDVVYVQNRGAGQSFRPQAAYSIADMSNDLTLVLNDLKIANTHLLGFSMGGRIAQQFALTNPKKLQKLVLVSTASGWNTPFPPPDTVMQHLLQFDGSDEGFAKTFEILYSPEARRNATARAFVKFRKADPFPQSLTDYQLQLQAIVNFDVTSLISQIQTPTFVLAGDQDALTPFANSLHLHQHLPNSQIKIYESTGHLLQFEKQKDFLLDISTFLKRNPMTANVVIYSTDYCPYCHAAKALFTQKKVNFTEINVENDTAKRTWLAQITGQRTVPQIFINDKPYGGFSDIKLLDESGQLDTLLGL